MIEGTRLTPFSTVLPKESDGGQETLRVTEIYASIQGESTWAGRPCVFVRTTGCPLRCRWCDTVYAFTEGQRQTVNQIVDQAAALRTDLCELTGGEPLAQPGAAKLLSALCDRFDDVLLETSGSFPIEDLDSRVHVILDLKAPGSGEVDGNLMSNIDALKSGDEVKFVLADRTDFDWALRVVEEHDLTRRGPVHFSPVHGELDPRTLTDWILETPRPVRLQVQIHKYIWEPDARGV